MATISTRNKDASLRRIIKGVLGIRKASNQIEMGMIPNPCIMSACASLLALRRPQKWVYVPLTAGPTVMFDLRKNKEA